ncbi:hypothetical protein IGB42_00100 [Andreprevotia sp. IGB-42]|uniref:META and DUF4377 domain-containing protein n=1 Tax=Andreprevotia sp. IGB-42 TaxID=2497473 RepID=UPI001356D194|nr:META and DUF4377 domain-containing protein [Andreprevotia sp. IGB-42]KAF0815023.1 hypothetical protein IGB42_00100 [Andreprevotia sp. IGB-42]
MRKSLFISALALSALASLAQARSLLDGDYRIDRVVAADGAVIRPVDPRIGLTVEGERVSGFSGCNRFMGAIRYMDSKITLGPLAGTRMMCIQNEVSTIEHAVLATLDKVNAFGLNPQQKTVVLRGDHGELVSLLRRDAVEEKVLEIAPQKVECTGVGKMECLQVRGAADEPWTLLYQQIEGFDFKAGVSYRLRVREERVPNPPADAPATRLILVDILESK